MPYIKQEDREKIKNELLALLKRLSDSEQLEVGTLNYVITNLTHHYVKIKGLNYKHINDCIGVLECAKLEMYRKVAINYEELKCKENGDV